MMSHSPATADRDLAAHDLGPLAWVLEELRKSLDGATKATRRFVRDAELALGQDIASLDASHLRIARQQLHQAVGALEMVGLQAPATMLRAMESLAQRFVQKPESCSDDAATALERASFALTEYLEGLVKGKNASSVALFPQYRAVAELAGLDRVHPADLWPIDWRWLEVGDLPEVQPLEYSPATREKLDWAILNIVKSADTRAARRLSDLACGLAAGQDRLQPRTFWAIAAAYFEALACGAVGHSVYSKRAASRVLQQYATLSKGDRNVSERLAQDLLFFCAVARTDEASQTACLQAVRQAYGLAASRPVDFETEQFGRFDPALLQLLRKRIAAASESWSAVSGGDAQRLKQVGEHFAAVADLMGKLHPESKELARALARTVDTTVSGNAAPSPAVAMEVATTVLYLDAVYEDLDPTDSELARRAKRLAQRLDLVSSGQAAAPMESWMEDLYRRVSDRQTMGSVVSELRGALGTVEKSLDAFFRAPQDKAPLREVPNQLASMRGVFSVLGLDQPSIAAQRMRLVVEQLLVDEIAPGAGSNPLFEQLGANLGAMGFLIDMLSYQRELAKKLFAFDEESNTLKPLMGRAPAEVPAPVATTAPAPETHQGLQAPSAEASALDFDLGLDLAAPPTPVQEVSLAADVVLPEPAAPLSPPAPPPAPVVPAPVVPAIARVEEDDDDAELLDIFLEEAREVVQNGLAAIGQLHRAPSDVGELTVLRRAFHTLKGSSRMVGLTDFGEAAWSFEQVMNSLLSEQRAAEAPLLRLAEEALTAFGRWIDDTANSTAGAWSASPFQTSADAMRLRAEYVPLALAGQLPVVDQAPDVSSVLEEPLQTLEPPLATEIGLDSDDSGKGDVAEPVLEPELAEAPPLELEFGLDLEVPAAALAPPEPAIGIETKGEPEHSFEPLLAEFPATQTLDLEMPSPDVTGTEVQELELGDFDFAAFGEPAVVQAPPVEELAPPLDIPAPAPSSSEPVVELEFPVPLPEPIDTPQALVDAMPAAPESEALAPAAVAEEVISIDLDFPLDSTPVALDVAAELAVGAAPVDAASVPAPLPESAFHDAVQDLSLDLDLPVSPDLAQTPPAVETNAIEEAAVIDEAETIEAQTSMVGAEPAALSPEDGLEQMLDDSVKVIGSMRLSIPLYNVFLNEADEWSRMLQNELSEWALCMDEPVPESTVVWAHSLAGSSATVGFAALSDLSRMLEHALQHVRLHHAATTAMAQVFNDAAEDVRRLLHQFAAGFLKEPNTDVMAALQQIVNTEFAPASNMEAELSLEESLHTRSEYPAEAESALLGQLEPQEPVEQVEPAPLPIPAAMAVAAPLAVLEDESDEELDAVDSLDEDLFPIFEEEALELLPQLSAGLRQWIAHPADMAARGDVLRVLHTLKGSARLAGAMRLGEMSHHMETSIEQLGAEGLQTAQLEPLQGRYDRIATAFDRVRHPVVAEPAVSEVVAESVPNEPYVAQAAPVEVSAEQGAALARAMAPLAQAAVAPVVPAGASRAQGQQTVRVRSRLLDRLVNEVGEVLITRSRMDGRLNQIRSSLEDLGSNLERLRQQLRDVELQSESQMQSRLAQAKDTAQGFDPLEFDRFTRVQELTRMMAESVHDVATVQRNLQREIDGTEDDLIAQGRQARELQRDLLRTRMVEFESVAERLYGVVRQASKDAGKPVKLDILGGSIEMDRGVLERMVPSFEHMLRNAVSHGIEDAATRSAAGKPAVGTVVVQVDQHVNDVTVSFSDDGGGLHLDRIRARAVAQGLVDAQQDLSTADAANLIFLPGFSTAEQITELSGRGIGMDVVRAEVLAQGGRIETSTDEGKGSQFKLVLPLTTAVTQVVMLRVGELTVGVPSNLVETVQRAQSSVVQNAYDAGRYPFGAETLPFYWLGALLQASGRSTDKEAKSMQVVVLQSAGQRVAVHIDEVLGNREVVVKNLGPQLARLPGLTGMSVLASGAVVLIYNPVALSTVYGERARAWALSSMAAPSVTALEGGGSEAAVPEPVAQLPLVLVVDDSITVRRVTQRLLKREGYRVAVANDGLHALEKLMEEKPAVVLSDIEMPRMDGFDLARNIRGDARLHDLPIIMITSRIAQKHRDHAKELGVDHYLGKPYSEDELLALVHKYAHQDAPASVL